MSLKEIWQLPWRRGQGAPITWPVATRLRLGAAYGLVLGIGAALIDAIFGNWSSGVAFSRVHPAGLPFEAVFLFELLVIPGIGALAALLFPLYRTAVGAGLAGILTIMPAVLIAQPWVESPRSILTVWDRLALAVIICIGALLGAVGVRPHINGTTDEAETRDVPT